MTDRPGLDFSFSGLKTAVLIAIGSAPRDASRVADIAAAMQEAAVDTLVIKCKRAMEMTGHNRLVVAGGVSANQLLQQRLEAAVSAQGARVWYPRQEFCTDNGAMIAYAGWARLRHGETQPLAFDVRPQWRMDEI
jgi:N6-L-threonylcarbamoyladenine synthase